MGGWGNGYWWRRGHHRGSQHNWNHHWKKQWGGNNAMSFNYWTHNGCPVLNRCYDNYFKDMGWMGDYSGSWDKDMCRNANHNLYECFREAFHGENMCDCATWQVEEASMYNHGYETDYSRHMNMQCQGFHDYWEQDQQCDSQMMQCASRMEYLMWNDLRYKCSRRQDIEFVRQCFHQMRSSHNSGQHSCQYTQWFYRMSRDKHIDQLFNMFEMEIDGCPVNQVMYSCGHDYDHMGPSVMCSMGNHYMREYSQCMNRMMQAIPECHGMRNMQQANRELMHFFMQDQCQMHHDVRMQMSQCGCGGHYKDKKEAVAIADKKKADKKDTHDKEAVKKSGDKKEENKKDVAKKEESKDEEKKSYDWYNQYWKSNEKKEGTKRSKRSYNFYDWNDWNSHWNNGEKEKKHDAKEHEKKWNHMYNYNNDWYNYNWMKEKKNGEKEEKAVEKKWNNWNNDWYNNWYYWDKEKKQGEEKKETEKKWNNYNNDWNYYNNWMKDKKSGDKKEIEKKWNNYNWNNDWKEKKEGVEKKWQNSWPYEKEKKEGEKKWNNYHGNWAYDWKDKEKKDGEKKWNQHGGNWNHGYVDSEKKWNHNGMDNQYNWQGYHWNNNWDKRDELEKKGHGYHQWRNNGWNNNWEKKEDVEKKNWWNNWWN